MPKPTHLTWEEAAVNALCNSTAYRMLVSHNGAPVTQGDVVLIWGASGGIGSFAVQHVLNSGGTPIGVVSSDAKVETLHELGCEYVIDRRANDYRFWKDEHTQDEGEWRRLGKDIRALVGDDPDIVFEHPGRSTMGASVFVAKRGGTIVTCAATSGYMIEYDNRHLWMKLKTIKGSHFSNYARPGRQPDDHRRQGRAPAVGGLSLKRPAKRPTKCTTTDTRARSGSCASRLRRSRHHQSGASRARRRGTADDFPSTRSGGAVTSQLTEIDHVALRSTISTAAIAWYESVFGAVVVHREVVESDGVDEALVKVAESYIQLLTRLAMTHRSRSTSPRTARDCTTLPIESTTVRKTLEIVKKSGARVIDQTPRPGSRGTIVAFVHPKGSFGTLIELVEETN